MTLNIKTLGATLLAALALSGVAVTAASAESFSFYGGDSLSLEGANDSAPDRFTVNSGEVECASASYSGEMSEAEASAIELAPTYAECEAFGLEATVEMQGCTYRFTAGSFESETATGAMDIVCPEGKKIKIETGGGLCTVEIPPQTGLGGISYTNLSGSSHEVTIAGEGENLKYSEAGVLCITGSHENGTYSSSGVVTTEGAGEATGLAVAKPNPLFVLNPANLNFEAGGAGKKKNVVIENKSQAEPEIDMIITIGKFTHKDKCIDKVLKKEGMANDKCTEEVECLQAKAVGWIVILATDSFAVNKAKLENC